MAVIHSFSSPVPIAITPQEEEAEKEEEEKKKNCQAAKEPGFKWNMASEELAKKLQSRLVASEENEPNSEPDQNLIEEPPLQPADASGEAPSELAAKLTRRLDINEGTAAPRTSRVFNPYTEFKEFSRKQIKDMESMFKR